MIAYVIVAGLRGVAWTDTIQGLFMLSVTWLAVGWVLLAVGGPGAATARLADANPEFLALGGGVYSPQFVIGTALTIAFGVTTFPQINQRFFVAGSERVLKRSFALWPVLVVLLFVPAFMLGSWAAGLGVQVGEGGNVVPALLNAYTPAWFAALVIAGALAAMMSSSDSMLLSGSAYLTRDLYRPLVAPDASDAREGWVARLGVAGFALAALAASLYAGGGGGLDVLVTLGDTAFGGYAQLTLPLLAALYWGGTTRTGMVAGVLGGQAAYLLHVFVSEVVLRTLHLPAVEVGGVRLLGEITIQFGGIRLLGPTYLTWDFALWCMLLGLVLTVGVSMVTRPAPGEAPAKFGVRAD
jgi:SSS family solute:Na+ symporter